MKFLLVLLLCFQATNAVMHSWKAFYTASTGMSEFPEFVALNLLDDEVMGYFDSKTNRFESKQSWVTENMGEQYVEQETNTLKGWVPTFKANIATAMKRFNESTDAHILQFMYGCEWDDETQEVNGFRQYGYDGEDFISFDLKTLTWIAPKPQALISKIKLDSEKAGNAQRKNYLTQICVDWLKKYVNYGRSSLMRTDLPSVSLLQKTPSSKVSCFATGFYPDRATMFWRKGGDDLHEGVELGEILPNDDGSFQMNVELDVSSVKSGDWGSYECVFQLSGVKDIITKLDKTAIKSNGGFPLGAVIGGVVVLLLLVVGIAGFFLWKKNKKGKEGFKPANPSASDTDSDNSVPLNQKA